MLTLATDTATTLQTVRFQFEDSPAFDGFADGTTWNGYANVWISPEVREQVVAWLREQGDEDTADEIMGLPVEDGLVSLANGYTAQIVDETESR